MTGTITAGIGFVLKMVSLGVCLGTGYGAAGTFWGIFGYYFTAYVRGRWNEKTTSDPTITYQQEFKQEWFAQPFIKLKILVMGA